MTFHLSSKSPPKYLCFKQNQAKNDKKITKYLNETSIFFSRASYALLALPQTIMNILTLDVQHEKVRSYFNFANRLFWADH
jgi:hypothetical protein